MQQALAPAAQHLQSYGRGEDSVLVHMTPGEVSGLQQLAMAHGGSLTINPHTGLPEAGFLSKILPMVLGVGLNFLVPGLGVAIGSALGGIGGAAGTALAVGAGYTAATGSLKEGLMAGLGAYGGASLGGALGLGGAAAAPGAMSAGAVGAGGAGVTPGVASLVPTQVIAPGAANAANLATQATAFSPLTTNAVTSVLNPLTQVATKAPVLLGPAPSLAAPLATAPARAGLAGALDKFGATAAVKGVPQMLTTGLAGYGLMSALTPQPAKAATPATDESKFNYQGPYLPTPRTVLTPPADRSPTDSSEFQWFDRVNPYPAVYPSKPTQGMDTSTGVNLPHLAAGGDVHLKNGSFVVDARTVSEIGNGSSRAGQEALAKHGGQPIMGPGDGTSDSIPASIGGRQAARVARDEVKFNPEAVRRIGKGSAQRGAKKLYALMDRAAQARKQAGRGEDTKLRGLAAIR